MGRLLFWLLLSAFLAQASTAQTADLKNDITISCSFGSPDSTDWKMLPPVTKVDYVSFTGLSGLSWRAFKEISDQFTDKVISVPGHFQDMTDQACDALQQQGYFKAAVETHIEVTEPGERPPGVTVNIGLQPGQLFRLKAITVTGAKAFRPEVIRNTVPLYPGEIFDTAVIRYGLDEMRKFYGKSGYIDFTPVPDSKVDSASGTVTLIIDVDEGAHYTSDLRVLGLSPELTKQIERSWNREMVRGYDKYKGDELLEKYRPQFPVEVRVEPWENLLSTHRDDQQHIAHVVLDLRQ